MGEAGAVVPQGRTSSAAGDADDGEAGARHTDAVTCSFADRLLRMMDRGCGLVVGTCSPDGEPRAGRAWAVRVVDESARRLRLTMGVDDPTVAPNLDPGRIIAVTGADVRTLESVQVKGRITSVGPVDDADVASMAQQTELFFEAIHEVDRNPLDHLRRMLPSNVLAVEFEVTDAFDQSAGPDAGARVASA